MNPNIYMKNFYGKAYKYVCYPKYMNDNGKRVYIDADVICAQNQVDIKDVLIIRTKHQERVFSKVIPGLTVLEYKAKTNKINTEETK